VKRCVPEAHWPPIVRNFMKRPKAGMFGPHLFPQQGMGKMFTAVRKGAVRVMSGALQRGFEDNLSVLSAGVAFYAFLSIFPAVAGALMVWGLFAETPDIRAWLNVLGGIAPPEAFRLVLDELVSIAQSRGPGMTLGAIVSFVFALWSASRAAQALMAVIDIAYDLKQPRGFLASNLAALKFTLTGIAFAVFSLAAIGAVPPILQALRLGAVAEALFSAARWLLLVAIFLVTSANAYRNTPSHKGRKRSGEKGVPIWPGAVAASTIWLVASFGFSFYLAEFNSYNRTFGSLGAVAALLMWFWISAYAIGVGAEVNAELDDVISARNKQV
jgi:membrane protein